VKRIIKIELVLGFFIFPFLLTPLFSGLNSDIFPLEEKNQSIQAHTLKPCTSSVTSTTKESLALIDYEWKNIWGGSGYEKAWKIANDSSNNIYVAAYTSSYGAGNNDAWLVKFNSDGVQLWNRTWGGTNAEVGMSVAIDDSDNIYLVGYTGTFGAGGFDTFIVKYDINGNQLWNRTWGGSNNEYPYYNGGVAIGPSNDIYITGQTDSFGAGNYDVFIAKYDNNGNQLWNRTWGTSFYDVSNGIKIDSQGNMFVAGRNEDFAGDTRNPFLLKLNSSGDQVEFIEWGIYGYINDLGIDSTDSLYIVKILFMLLVNDIL